MEKDINIADILRNKPQGTKLYSPIWGECQLDEIYSDDSIIVSKGKNKQCFSKDGRLFENNDAECLLFWSKELKDWSALTWKKGDILINDKEDEQEEVIFDHFINPAKCTIFEGKHLLCSSEDNCRYVTTRTTCDTVDYTLADPNEAKCYINTLEEMFDGTLDRKTYFIVKKRDYSLKPYDKVLVRNQIWEEWHIELFGYWDDFDRAICMRDTWTQCIPFKSNEQLLGTTKNFRS